MKLCGLFTLHQGNSFELGNMETCRQSGINFVARTGENNGVTARVKAIEAVAPFPAGFISVALGGSVLSSFVQYKPFYTGFHVMILEPKKQMRLEEKLFYCHCIKMNAYRYQYGRQANKTLKYIELPELPEWLGSYAMDYSKIITGVVKKEMPLDFSRWEKFKIDDIFCYKRGKGITKEEIEENTGLIPCIQSGETNRGIIGYMNLSFINDKFHAYVTAPFLSLARSGTSGCVHFQDSDSYVGDSAIALKLRNKDNETTRVYLFLETVLNQERYRFTYGRKVVIDKYIEQYISLPANEDGNPDWQYMEKYVKALSYSDKL